MAARQFRIRGRVQGVWFRGTTREQALRLGLYGSAVNLPDGSVEVRAQGTPDALAELERWLWRGPPSAEVASVEVEDLAETPGLSGFVTG